MTTQKTIKVKQLLLLHLETFLNEIGEAAIIDIEIGNGMAIVIYRRHEYIYCGNSLNGSGFGNSLNGSGFGNSLTGSGFGNSLTDGGIGFSYIKMLAS